MAAAKFPLTGDFRIEKGASYIIRLVFKDGAGAVICATGWAFDSEIRDTFDATTIDAEFSFDQSATGWTDMTLDVADTITLPEVESEDYKRISWFGTYDVFADKGGGVVDRVLEGDVEVSPQVTE